MKPRIFIDGQEGTTGLQIYDRLGARNDIELITIDDALRKDTGERTRMLNNADLVFLCLPDDAAREALRMIDNSKTRIIDASTAHRTDPRWVYGFPELSKHQRQRIEHARFVSNPGCHATGFIAMVYPLISLDIMPRDYLLTCFSLTGYSGGGKKMIREYEKEKTPDMYSPRLYGLDLNHKHLPEMQHVTGLMNPPVFCPIVNDYYSGMSVTITLHNKKLNGKPTVAQLRDALSEYYNGERYITVAPEPQSGGIHAGTMLESNWGSGTNNMEITVSGNDKRSIVTARFDNLGKGASGAAVQNMEIMLKLV